MIQASKGNVVFYLQMGMGKINRIIDRDIFKRKRYFFSTFLLWCVFLPSVECSVGYYVDTG